MRNLKMPLRALLCASVLIVSCAAAAQAAIVVNVGSISLGAGASGFVPVTIYSTDSDLLASTNFEFRLTPSGPAGVEFTDSLDPLSAQTFNSTNPNYVFSGNSLFQSIPFPIGSTSQTTVPGDTFIGGDLNGDSSAIPIGTLASPSLLVDLPVTAAAGLSPGSTFSVSLIAGPNTDFSDGSNSYAFTSTSGTVTIAETAAVPEPSTLVMTLHGLAALAVITFRRQRRSRACR